MKLRDLSLITESQKPKLLYHLTNDAHFAADPAFTPDDNAVSIQDRSGHAGIYLAPDIEPWVNGKGYWRPFVVEFSVHPDVYERDQLGRWSGEVFVSSKDFDLIEITRVIPIDAYAREKYGQHGWIESVRNIAFDTGEPYSVKYWEYPFQGWKYPGDLRQASETEISRLKRHFEKGMELRDGWTG